MISRNLIQNGREMAHMVWFGDYSFAHSPNGCSVISAVPAFIPAVHISQLFRTPSQSGQRAVHPALLPVLFSDCCLSAGFGRLSAGTSRLHRFGLPKVPDLSCVAHKKMPEHRGLLSCITELGLPQARLALRLPHAAIRPDSRLLSGPARVQVLRFCLTPIPLQVQRWGPEPTIFTASKSRVNARNLGDGARRTRPAFPPFKIHNLTAARLSMRGGFVCDIPLTKRDLRCLRRS